MRLSRINGDLATSLNGRYGSALEALARDVVLGLLTSTPSIWIVQDIADVLDPASDIYDPRHAPFTDRVVSLRRAAGPRWS